jgi:hypothetical protein
MDERPAEGAKGGIDLQVDATVYLTAVRLRRMAAVTPPLAAAPVEDDRDLTFGGEFALKSVVERRLVAGDDEEKHQ